jgi:hypothetical protein
MTLSAAGSNGSTDPHRPPTSVVPRDLLDLCTAILYAVPDLALSKSSQRQEIPGEVAVLK